MAGNPFDHSNIILSNQAGANLARGIEGASAGLSRGIERFGQRQEENNRFLSKAKALETFIKANAADMGADPKEVLTVDPKESPAARFDRLSGMVENVILQKKLAEAKQMQAMREQEMAANRFMQTQRETNAAALRGAFAPQASQLGQAIQQGASFESLPAGASAKVSAQDAVRNYVSAGGTPDSATSQFFNAALDAEAMQAASGQPRQRYRQTGPVMDKGGKFLGYGAFDQATGEAGIVDEAGNWSPLPADAEPVTATGLQKQVPSINDFRKMKGELTDAEISLRNMDRYVKSVGDANVGLQRLADKFSAGIKTLVGEKKLDPQELAAKMAQGQLQGLLGANRTNVVGGGVMTEQDALRIIERLGGDFGALSNPEVVRQAIAQVYSDRYKQYDDAFKFYNAAVADYYGSRGFDPAKRVEYKDFTAGGVDQPEPLTIKSIKKLE